MAGRQPNIVGYYSGWAQPFDMAFAKTLQAHGVVPFVQIDPTAASIDGIADGTYDDYLRSYADSVRNFRHAVVIGFGHEMNASWYPWGYKHVPAATFVAAWRHIVTLFRKEGAENVTWLWTLQADQPGTGPIASWWPGASYVNWVGIDGYYYRSADTFASVFGTTITQVRTFTSKPVLLSETAVGPAAGPFAKIQDLFHGMAKYKTLGLVWFDKTQHGERLPPGLEARRTTGRPRSPSGWACASWRPTTRLVRPNVWQSQCTEPDIFRGPAYAPQRAHVILPAPADLPYSPLFRIAGNIRKQQAGREMGCTFL